MDILGALIGSPKTISELQTQGFAKSTLYKHLNEIQETGAIAHTDDGYAITDDTLRSFLEARTRTTPFETEYRANGDRLVATSKDTVDGTSTLSLRTDDVFRTRRIASGPWIRGA
ncbi:hypothetical protein [Haloarcula sp. Atlit-7R]|uniref:hypothetical protein n=1 Tax=Haloarcula sp. Atlit-7R TaxID=2282125 RepID=UPI000EF169C7|nr:hypothetical protein [Haloarcula sp. Atlit-7R]RLM90007.1 hypothetical protein D3D01_18075 [Haloarcula sp. Atlit-7R]